MNSGRLAPLVLGLLAAVLLGQSTADDDGYSGDQGQKGSRNVFVLSDGGVRYRPRTVGTFLRRDGDSENDDSRELLNPFLIGGRTGGAIRGSSDVYLRQGWTTPFVGIGGSSYNSNNRGSSDVYLRQGSTRPFLSVGGSNYNSNNRGSSDVYLRQGSTRPFLSVRGSNYDSNNRGSSDVYLRQGSTRPFVSIGGSNYDSNNRGSSDVYLRQGSTKPFLNVGGSSYNSNNGGRDTVNGHAISLQNTMNPFILTDQGTRQVVAAEGQKGVDSDGQSSLTTTTESSESSDVDGGERYVAQATQHPVIIGDDDKDDDDSDTVQGIPITATADDDSESYGNDDDSDDDGTDVNTGNDGNDDSDGGSDDGNDNGDSNDDSDDDSDDNTSVQTTQRTVTTTTHSPVTTEKLDQVTTTTSSPVTTEKIDQVTTTTRSPITTEKIDQVTTTTHSPVTTEKIDQVTQTTRSPITTEKIYQVTTTTSSPVTTVKIDQETPSTRSPITTEDGTEDGITENVTQTTPSGVTVNDGEDNGNNVQTTTMAATFDGDVEKQGCRSLLEVVAVVDGSDSISSSEFALLKDSLTTFLDSLSLGNNEARFGLVLFSQNVTTMLPLSGNKALLEFQISSLRHPRDGTNTALGIAAMTDIFNMQGRLGVPRVGVVITDGISKDTDATARMAAIARAMGVDMFAVGVTNKIDMTELNAIASRPSQVFTADQFASLKKVIAMLVKEVCPTTTTSTTTTTTTTTTTPAPTTTTTTPTTTTTTPAPTTTTKKPEKGLCTNCKIVNGVGYNPYPGDCTRYIQCQPLKQGKYLVHIRTCAPGTFWNQRILACDSPKNAQCPYDRCLAYGVKTYQGQTGCRAYWVCQSGVSQGYCCPWGTAFAPGRGCLPSSSCKDSCGSPAYSGLCEKKAVPGRPSQYLEKVWSTWTPRFCAPGTHFSQLNCQCSRFGYNVPAVKECKPEIYLPFTNAVRDESGNGNYVHNEGVKIINGVAYFDGKSSLRIPRFSNADLGSTLVIRLNYREAVASPGRAALVTNGDCNKDGTVFVTKETGATSFGVKNVYGVLSTVSVPHTVGTWKTVELRLDAGALSGIVDGQFSQVPAKGAVGQSKWALQIGRGEGFQNFQGYMDEVTVYLCRPAQ